jgi:hypothetical protein
MKIAKENLVNGQGQGQGQGQVQGQGQGQVQGQGRHLQFTKTFMKIV